MDLIYTILFIVIGYYAYYKVIKPNFIDGKKRSKINENSASDADYVDYEEVED